MPEASLQQWQASGKMPDWKWNATDGFVHAHELHPPEPLDHLYRYLLGCQFIVPMRTVAK
jgi:hypothetical protein